MQLPFPQKLEPEANTLIHTRNDLERSGILADVEYHIKRELRISDEIEEICHTPTEELTTTDVWHMKNLLRENPDHPYAILLKEKIDEVEPR